MPNPIVNPDVYDLGWSDVTPDSQILAEQALSHIRIARELADTILSNLHQAIEESDSTASIAVQGLRAKGFDIK
jgi:hypothetical protein